MLVNNVSFFSAMRKFNKILKYFLISLGGLIVLFMITAVIVASLYEKEIKQYMVNAINKNLRTEIKIDEIKFSVFRKFPDASLEFTNVLIKSVKDINKSDFMNYRTDTLLSAKKLFLQFNIIDIFNKHYTIKKIHMDRGRICLFTDAKGRDNYHFWKTSNNSDTATFRMKLKKISFSDVALVYVDKAYKMSLTAHSENFVIKGDLSAENYILLTSGELFFDKFMLDGTNFIHSEKASLELQMNVHNNEFQFVKSTLAIADFALDVSGKVKIDKKNFLDIFVNGRDIDIQSILSILPEKYSKFKKDYNSDGNFYFETHISGESDSLNFAHIEIKFGVKNGTVSKDNSDLKLTGISLEGLFSNGAANAQSTSSLKIGNFKANIGHSIISGTFNLENFNHFHVSLDADANINLSEAQEFFRFDTIKEISGMLNGNFKFSGNIQNVEKFTTDDFRNSVSSGTVIMEKVNLFLKDQKAPYTSINGIFNFNNNDAEIKSLQFKFQDNDFAVNGKLLNILCYIMIPGQKCSVDGNVLCQKLDVSQLLQSNATSEKSPLKINFPDDVSLNVSLTANDFTFEKFTAKNVYGKISYSNKNLVIENVSFHALQGNIVCSGTIQQEIDGRLFTKVNTSLQKININQMFTVCNNFGQDFITDKNLQGIVTADINLSAEWNSNLTCLLNKLVIAGNVNISNGELNNFKPLDELADFISLNDIKNIHFSDIKNDILIKDEKIIIPQMDIHSSALDLTVSGEQTFDYKIDYRLKVLLSDVLFAKARKNKKQNNEFGAIEDDGLGKTKLSLIVSGTTDDFKIRYDTKTMKESIKESAKDEKNNLKNILHEEFGLFKKDSAMSAIKKKNEDDEKQKKKKRVKIQWDENSDVEKDRSDEK